MREEIPQLTEQFFVTLRAKLARVDRESLDEHRKAEYENIQGLLEKKTWRNAYEAEQRLLQIQDSTSLETEADRRQVEAARHLNAALAALYKTKLENADEPTKRALTSRIVDDLQWRYQQEQVKESFRRLAAWHAGWWLIVAVFLFVSCFFWCGEPLAVAIFSGMLGAAFSWVVGLNARVQEGSFNELKMLRRFWYGFPRLTVGVGAATILFFLLQAGALGGTLFPEFRREVHRDRLERALLTVIEYTHDGVAVATGENDWRTLEPAVRTAIAASVDDLVTLLTGDASEDSVERKLTALVEKIPIAVQSRDLSMRLQGSVNDVAARSALGLDSINLALLILWSVIAGFSERFVPTLLRSHEQQAGADDSEQERQQTLEAAETKTKGTTPGPTDREAKEETPLSGGDPTKNSA